LGNHDFSVRESRKRKVPDLLNIKSGYYSLTRNNWQFIFLDGTDISTFSRREKDPEYKKAQSILDSLKKEGAPNAHSWNGGVGKNTDEMAGAGAGQFTFRRSEYNYVLSFPDIPESQPETSGMQVRSENWSNPQLENGFHERTYSQEQLFPEEWDSLCFSERNGRDGGKLLCNRRNL
jgi:hypothetical protein